MKKWISLLFCLLIFCSIVLPVRAASDPVQDFGGLLNTAEEEVLSDWCRKIQSEHSLDVVLLAIPDLMGKSAQNFADDFYDNNRYGPDGVLFLVDMGSRQWHISTAGTAIERLSDRDLEKIENAVIPYFSDGRFYDGFCRFLDILPDYLENDRNSGVNLLLSLIVGAAAAGAVVLIMCCTMNTQKSRHSAQGYTVDNSYQLRQHQDLFLYSSLSKRPRPKSNSSGNSVHRSSSGRSHGGRSGRF